MTFGLRCAICPACSAFFRLLSAGLIFLSLALAGTMPAMSATSHDRMEDCPHAMAVGAPHGAMPDRPAAPMPIAVCCILLPAANAAAEIAFGLPNRGHADMPRPVSDRLPFGASPGPELPPPRA